MEYKKTIILLVLAIFLVSISGVCASEMDDTLASEDTNAIELSADNDVADDNLQITQENDDDEILSTQTDNDVLSDNSGNYSELSKEIGSGGNVELQHDYYTYDDSAETIEISVANSVIDGRGAVIDMAGSSIRAFNVTASGVIIKNLTIKNTNYNGDGGAIFFSQSGTVTDCNFTNNKITGVYTFGGAVYFRNEGTVTNCNFDSNTATYEGGALFIWEEGIVTNCNFTDNSAVWGGAIYFYTLGTVTDCNFNNNKVTGDYSYGGALWMNYGSIEDSNFADNTAAYEGGAVWMYYGSIENSNFTGNNATTGAAIYFGNESTIKTIFNSRFFNNRANAERLQVTKNENNITITFTGNNNLLNAIYSNGDVLFTNVEYWGVNGINNTGTATLSGSKYAAGQNISVVGYINGRLIDTNETTDADGKIVFGDASGDYYLTVRHNEDLYYTQAETVSSNMNLYVNITSLTTNNRTVNITAKSNIYNETMPGKLIFVLSDDNQLDANYAGNGSWWAVHTFDEFKVYEANASYIGLDDVSIYNATLNIAELPTNITLKNDTVELFAEDSVDVGATLTPEVAGTLTFTSSNETVAIVEGGKIIAVSEGVANITVSFAGSEGYLPALNKTIAVKVNRVVTHIVIGNITTYPELDVNITLNVTSDDNRPFNDYINLTLPNGTVISVKIINGEAVVPWTVPDNYYGKYSINATFEGNNRYLPSNATADLTVNKYGSNVTISEISTVVYPNNVTVKYSIENRTKVIVTVDGVSDDRIIIANDTITVVGLIPGNHTIRIVNNESNLYHESSDAREFSVNKSESKVTISEISTVVYPNNVTIKYSIENRTKVTVSVDGVSQDMIVVANDVITVVGLVPGKYTIRIANNESDLYHGSSDAREFTVNKSESNVTISEIVPVIYPNSVIINYTIENRTNMTVTVDGVSQDKIIIANDTITVIGLDAGNYTIRIANNESDLYHGSSDVQNFTVNMNPSKIAASSITATYNINKNLLITLTDVNGKPLSGAKVTVNIKGAKEYTTDSKGQIKVSTKGLVPKKYTAKIAFKGNNNYIGSSLDVKVTVNKAKPKIVAKKKTFKAKAKKKKFTITLKNNIKKPIKKVKVRLTVKKIGKKSKKTTSKKTKKTSKKSKKKNIVKTNKKGKATFKVKVNKKGKYWAIIKFSGNKYYKAVTKKVKITIK